MRQSLMFAGLGDGGATKAARNRLPASTPHTHRSQSSHRSQEAVPSEVMLPQYDRNLGSRRVNMGTVPMGDPSRSSSRPAHKKKCVSTQLLECELLECDLVLSLRISLADNCYDQETCSTKRSLYFVNRAERPIPQLPAANGICPCCAQQ